MFSDLYASAGLGHFPLWRLQVFAAFLVAGIGLSAFKLSGIAGVGFAGTAIGMAALLEVLKGLGRQRRAAVTSALPEVIEALAAGVASGQELTAALVSLQQHGPKALRRSFQQLALQQNQGLPLEHSLSWLQVEISQQFGDQLVQLLLISLRSGGDGLVTNLNRLSQQIRNQGALEAELEAKQGWVTGTAKLGLVAPWLIVLFLSARPEAKAFYASTAGSTLLLLGLLICLGSYFLIVNAGRLPQARRVFHAGD